MFAVLASLMVRARRRLSFWRKVGSGTPEKPERLWEVSERLTALLSPVDSPMSTHPVLITALNRCFVVCRSPSFVQEGERLNLELPGSPEHSADVEVLVEWVDISGVAHRLGLRIVNKRRSQEAWESLCCRLEAGTLRS